MGDTSGNRYVGGVYDGRLFRYHTAETETNYEWRRGQLRYATGQRVLPTQIAPDIIVKLGSPFVTAPPGATEISTPTRAYITEVEFIAPNSYRLVPDAGDILIGSY